MTFYDLLDVFDHIPDGISTWSCISEDSCNILQVLTPVMLMFGNYVFFDENNGYYVLQTYGRFEETFDKFDMKIAINDLRRIHEL